MREPIWRRVKRFWKNDPAADIDDELRDHRELRIEEFLARGMSRPQAETAADARFGDEHAVRRELLQIDVPAARRLALADYVAMVGQEVRFGARALRHPQPIGQIAAGYQADLIMLDLDTLAFTPLNDLRAALHDELPAVEIFEPLVAELCVKDFIRSGAAIRRASHRPALTPQLQTAGGKIRATLAAKPLDPPSKKDLAPDVASQQALRYLIQSGELIDINVEIVMTAEAVKQATAMVRDFIRKNGPATTSDLRQMLGNSRRVAIPLLERLDRDGVTVRQGDKRALRS